MSKGKKIIFGTLGAFIILIAIGAIFGESKPKQTVTPQNTNSNPSQNSEKPEERIEEIKYKDERLNALVVVQVHKTNHIINQGSKFEINAGTSLNQVFSKQKEFHLIREDGRWAVLKDEARYVVMYRGNLSAGGLNNPQWAVIPQNDLRDFTDAKIYALNGTAIGYTPELGYQDPKLDTAHFTRARNVYLRFMELGENPKYQASLESSNPDLRQKTEDEVMGIVAKEFGVSLDEANSMFFEGMQERNDEVREVNSERGNILSDERIIQLLQEQGDLYVGE